MHTNYPIVNKTKATLLGIVIWVILTVAFSKWEAGPDSFDQVGFPLYFYKFSSSKYTVTTGGGYTLRIDLINLLADLFFAIAFVLLLNFILLRIFKPKTTTL